MAKPDETTPNARPQERKYRRFNLRYPVHVKFHSGSLVSELDAVSRNVSLGGMLLETAAVIPQHSPVSFLMTVQAGRMVHPIKLAGEGEVVRVENVAAGAGFAVAVECKHPIAQIESILPTA
jgi:hypothetical protein